jgi:hypothetical protein
MLAEYETSEFPYFKVTMMENNYKKVRSDSKSTLTIRTDLY